jgi:4-hydroxyacetophenone monooxygenase
MFCSAISTVAPVPRTHPGMTTYYRNKQGRVFSAMPWRFVDYWRMTHDPDLGQYRQTPA